MQNNTAIFVSLLTTRLIVVQTTETESSAVQSHQLRSYH